MNPFYQTLLASVATGFLSSGGFAFITFLIQRHDQKKGNSSKQSKMLMGLAHDRITSLCEQEIKTGYTTPEQETEPEENPEA